MRLCSAVRNTSAQQKQDNANVTNTKAIGRKQREMRTKSIDGKLNEEALTPSRKICAVISNHRTAR
jgi:hypothetical protein